MVEAVKENLCINRIVGSKTFQINVQGDTIIPDTKPDILSDISANGNVCIYKKEVLEDKIRLDGNVNIYLMYLADAEDNRVRGCSSTIDFTEILDFPGVNQKMILDENVQIKNIECKVLNGRKVNFKILLEVDVNVSLNENEEIVKEVNNVDDIQLQITPLQMNSLIGQNSSKAYAKESLVIENTDTIAEILNTDFNITNKDTKVSYNKVLAKADINIRILYLTDEGRLKKVDETIPVMGFIDTPGVSEDNLCDVKYKLKNIIVKPNSKEEHSIYVEIELEIFCNVYENKDVNIIQDMYSPSKNLSFEETKVSTLINMKNSSNTINVRDRVQLEDIDYSKVCNVTITPTITEKNVLNDRVRINGELELNFVLSNNDENDLTTLSRSIPFDFTEEIEGLNPESRVNLEIVPKTQEFLVDNMDIEVRVDLEVNINSYNLETVSVIDNIQELENSDENPYSMIIYFVKQGDTLWRIAKKYKSTIKDIVRVNNIENPDSLEAGMQLFIPKCSVCRT